MKKRRKGRRRRMSRNWTMEAGLYHPADPEREVRLDDYVRGFASRVTTAGRAYSRGRLKDKSPS